MHEFLAWLTLLLLAQWFFGNLYEAIAFVPNLMSLLELTSASGEVLFKSKSRSPVAYYVPAVLLAMVTTSGLAAASLSAHRAGAAYIVVSCLLLFAAEELAEPC